MNGNPFYIEPANFMQGLNAIGEGLETRAGYMREKAKKKQTEELRAQAKKVLTEGTPDEIAGFVASNPEWEKAADFVVKPKNEKTKRDMAETSIMILNDPENAVNYLTKRADMLVEEGADASGTLAMLKAATEGKKDLVARLAENGLAYSSPDMFKAYKEQAGIGKKDQWIDWGYGKKKNLSTGEIATVETKPDEGKWIDWGYGQRKNTKTGKIEKVPTPPQKSGVGSAYNASKVYAVTDTVTGKRLYKSGAVLLNDTEGRFTPLTGDVNLSQEKSEARMRGGARAAAIDTANNLYQENAPKLISLRKKVEQKKLFPSGGLKTINQYQSWIGKNISDPDIAELTGKATLIAENLQRTVGGGVGEWTFRITKDLLDPNLSPEAFERRIKSHAEDISKMAESSRGFGQKPVAKPFYEKEAPKSKEQPRTKFERLPNPASLSGKTIRDDKTGILLKSDGKRWVKVK